jgi:hypothetical protein
MDLIPSGIRPIEETAQYVAQVLESVRQWTQAAPRLQELHDQLKWQEDVLTNCPTEATSLMQSGIGNIASQNQTYLKNLIPMPPPIDPKTISVAMAIGTSGATMVYGQLTVVASLGTPTAVNYVQDYTSRYQKLQAAQDRPQAVRALIGKLNPNTLDRFDKALAAFNHATLGIGSESAAAAVIRTLLDGVKGDLFSLARLNPNENMSWDVMAQRLGKSNRATIVREDTLRSSLYSQLSSILKDRGGALTTLAHLWTQVLDHLFTVLSLTT